MPARTSVVVRAGAGGRAIVRTADSVARQTAGVAELLIAASADVPRPPLAESLAKRHGAVWVHVAGATDAAAVNEAVGRSRQPYLAILPAGYRLPPAFLEHAEASLDEAGAVAGLVPGVLLQSVDGLRELHWHPPPLDLVNVVIDPAGAAPVLVLRRSVWEALRGLDQDLPSLAWFELCVRLAIGHTVLAVRELSVARDLDDPHARVDGETNTTVLRRILDVHRDAIEPRLEELLVAHEVRFAALRDRHRELVSERDMGLAELDRLRAESAHHRAYIEHHGRATVEWGDLRRPDPVSRNWGYDRGEPVDRRYIDEFLAAHSSDVRGAVLEVQEDDFTRRFGGPRVDQASVVDLDDRNPRATIVADLRCSPELPPERFDCVILTQTLHVVDDMPAVVRECHRLLKPGGVLLATMPAASRVCLEYGQDGDLWRMTPAGARALMEETFGVDDVSCDVYGSVLTNVAFLHGLGAAELTDAEFAVTDPYFPALTGVRARKPAARSTSVLRRSNESARGVVLLYHRIDRAADVHELAVPPDLFESHVRWLKAECHVLPLEDVLATPCGSLPERAVAVTFDDGYFDSLRDGAPLLERHGVPATFLLTSRWLDEPGEYWWDGLERILLGAGPVPSVLDLSGERLDTSTEAARLAAHWRLHERLVHARLDERDRLMASLHAWSGLPAGRVRPLRAEEAVQLSRVPGMTIGAHTVNHLSLRDQPHEVRQHELQDCRSALTHVLGRPVDVVAYPYGSLDAGSADLVRGGWRWGLTCDERILPESFDAARVPRLDVKRWSVADFAARVQRLFRPDPVTRPRATTLEP